MKLIISFISIVIVSSLFTLSHSSWISSVEAKGKVVNNTVVKTKKTVKKTKKMIPSSSLQGKWIVASISTSISPDGPFILQAQDNFRDAVELTFKGNQYCRSDLKDVIDETKPFCESFTLKKDGLITASRLEAFGGFMKLKGGQLEFIEGGKGFTKYVLKRKK